MFQQWQDKRKAHKEAVEKARAGFISWLEISKSPGWKLYQERIDREVSIIENEMHNNTNLSSEDLKRLQLALQVWKKVQRIPKDLEENAKGGK